MTFFLKRSVSLLLLIVSAGIGYWHISQHPVWSDFQAPSIVTNPVDSALQNDMEVTFLPTAGQPRAHSASLILLNDGNVMAVWFSGSREGAHDVVIQSTIFNTKTQTWGEPQMIIDRIGAQKGMLRYISKVGNPVLARAANGQLQLFFVTAFGGWATGSIAVVTSNDEGQTWGAVQRLVTSPFLNISTLVKSSAFTFLDKRMGLPVYHELLGRFGELLRIESATNVIQIIDKRRMSSGSGSLQPVIFVNSSSDATAYFRQSRSGNQPRLIPSSQSNDAGYTWEVGPDLSLPNPNAAIGGLTLTTGDRLLVLNDLAHGRYRLVMAMSRLESIDNGPQYSDWKVIKTLEDDSAPPKDRQKFDYPYLIQDRSNDVHLVYTFNKKIIKHVRFKTAYLESLWQVEQ